MNVPLHRRAEILVEPLYPRLGLLGGAQEGSGKMSKLAALAAARKKREAEKQGEAAGNSQSGGSGAHSPPEDQRSTSVSLLDRLASNTKPPVHAQSKPIRPLPKKGGSIVNHETEQTRRSSDTKAKETGGPLPPSSNPKAKISSVDQRISTPKVANLKAEPSAFAITITGGRNLNTTIKDSHISQNINVVSFFGQNFTEAFNFTEPSPDDIVLNAQNSSKGLSLR